MNRPVTKAPSPAIRADLEWSCHRDPERWIAHDPLTANFYCFNQIERKTVELLTGRDNLSEIVERLRIMFPATALDLAWLNSLVARLQIHHLLVPRSPADSIRLVNARSRTRRSGVLQQLLSPLAIRIPLFNPMRILNSLRPVAVVLFHPASVVLWLVAGAALGLFVLRELVSSHQFQPWNLSAIRGDRWLLLFVCYLFAKSLHELGHGLACVRNRSECREIGVMFLCLAPCLYCDTSDSWKLSSRWQRAGIAAAGMYVEWILATLAAAVWLFTRAGTLHEVAASLMVVCSLGTLLVNFNPFLKYDGYYVLSDVWGVPNLAEQGRDALRAIAYYLLSGRPLATTHFDAPVAWLAAYALVATLYRTFILAAILWISWSLLVPLGLGLVAVLVTAVMLLGLAFGQLRALRRLTHEVLAEGQMRVWRWLTFLAVCILALLFVLEFPLPSVIRCRGVTDFEDKRPLFVSQTAELVYAAPVNRRLRGGEKLLEFQAPDSRFELLQLQGQLSLIEQELEQLRRRSAFDPATAYQIPAKSEELTELRGRERVLMREMESLSHVAPQDGYLIAGPHALPAPITAPVDERFRRQALDPASLGSTCERSTLVGWFSTKQQLTLAAIVAEQDIKRLELGMDAAIQWDAAVSQIGRGKIVRIAPDAIEETPHELIGDPTLLSTRNAHGVFLPETPHYEVTIEVTTPAQRLLGTPATVQFTMPEQTLWQRAVELIRQNLKPL